MITTVDNFIFKDFIFDTKEKQISNNYYFKYSNVADINNNFNITFEQYKKNQNEIFQLSDKEPDSDDLILSLSSYKISDNVTLYTTNVGNYIGKFKYNNVNIDIKSRFSDTFLKRMLNFTNDIFLDDVSVFDAKENKKNDLDYSKFIIFYMFIQKLEKAFLLGLPKAYKTINHHEMKVKGKIDINRFIKYDIPFKGKISSISREQKEIQEIIDVLYKAITIIEKNEFSTKNILHIKTHLKQYKSNKYVSNEAIQKAINSKALQNPIFTPYKKVLKYAKLIIDANNLEEKSKGKEKTFGFLVNVAELFEIYLVKLLQHRMPDWDVKHEDPLDLYSDNFYSRKMFPDIVMKKDNQIMVFDAKYKRMKFRGKSSKGMGDLDRSDFFQINTYMTYYNNQENTTLIAGGLLYPIEKEFDCRFTDENCKEEYEEFKAHSNSWLENNDIKFIVDGIDLSGINDNSKILDIKRREDTFIERIKQLSGDVQNET